MMGIADEVDKMIAEHVETEVFRVMSTKSTINVWMEEAYMGVRKRMRELEYARNDLMGVNEQLRQKINALEYGQQYLLDRLEGRLTEVPSVGVEPIHE